ncbi:hypothetical protein EVAR_20847_1 [Eumeta japonica]|uniref:Uncharacterized protein n=1 Tax=Eumeta variegata TaxID=151549 RepID=A0A4C1UDH0_EUMVA|nr:hypothetical protein EVAR_20847_1 [Eumeta japonica]
MLKHIADIKYNSSTTRNSSCNKRSCNVRASSSIPRHIKVVTVVICQSSKLDLYRRARLPAGGPPAICSYTRPPLDKCRRPLERIGNNVSVAGILRDKSRMSLTNVTHDRSFFKTFLRVIGESSLKIGKEGRRTLIDVARGRRAGPGVRAGAGGETRETKAHKQFVSNSRPTGRGRAAYIDRAGAGARLDRAYLTHVPPRAPSHPAQLRRRRSRRITAASNPGRV